MLWSTIKSALGQIFAPLTRKINNKPLSSDVVLTGDDIATSVTDGTTVSSSLSNRVLKSGDKMTGELSIIRTFAGSPVEMRAYPSASKVDDEYSAGITLTRNEKDVAVLYFNEHGIMLRDIVAAQSNKVAYATPPQEFGLPLAEGVSAVSSAYWKDQFGVVSGHFNVLASSPQTGSSPVIATLPEGFRPSRQANATAVVSSGECLGLTVRTTGEIQLRDAASVTLEGKYIKGLFSFVAAN